MPSGSKLFFLTRELSLKKTCCLRADHEILIHNDESRSELIFVSARQHVLISDHTSSLKKTYSDSNIINNQNANILQCFQMDSFEADVAESYMFRSDIIKVQHVHAER